MRGIKYHPENVKDLLCEMKDTSELMLDLAYSAVIFENDNIATEVLKLEEKMNVLLYQVRISAILAARKVDEAEKLSGMLQIASAAEKISDAAGDIAKIVFFSELSEGLKAVLSEAEETITRVTIDLDSTIVNKTLGELSLKPQTGMRVIAIRRDLKWIYDPDRDTMVLGGDVIFARGPEEGVPILSELAKDEGYAKRKQMEEKIESMKDVADLIIQMKNTSELSVGLAYSSVLFHNEEIAHEVELLENRMDGMKNELEELVLLSARYVEDVRKLRALLHLGISSEVISDAAYEIADVVLRDIQLHPVFMLTLRESDEVICLINVGEKSKMNGRTMGDLKIETETGMYILGIRRKRGWIYHPNAKTEIMGGDSLIAKGTKEGEELLKKWSSG
jgi:uncharacterized protein with PhoU and TrkA domain